MTLILNSVEFQIFDVVSHNVSMLPQLLLLWFDSEARQKYFSVEVTL